MTQSTKQKSLTKLATAFEKTAGRKAATVTGALLGPFAGLAAEKGRGWSTAAGGLLGGALLGPVGGGAGAYLAHGENEEKKGKSKKSKKSKKSDMEKQATAADFYESGFEAGYADAMEKVAGRTAASVLGGLIGPIGAAVGANKGRRLRSALADAAGGLGGSLAGYGLDVATGMPGVGTVGLGIAARTAATYAAHGRDRTPKQQKQINEAKAQRASSDRVRKSQVANAKHQSDVNNILHGK